eukprot:TRINITY_DN353_c0_g2_i5.p1 TRINITY_DN353_c0_g2~~TRINITY_DN353_c0_g2_i5.p1  ORF type:complete len:859 (+),score=275.40 TRINITY_DN353_c0_g2_i5:577-3153(+)
MAERLKRITANDQDASAIKDKTKLIAELKDICRFLQVENNQLSEQVADLKDTLERSELDKRHVESKLEKTKNALKVHESKQVTLDTTVAELEAGIRHIEEDIRRFDGENILGAKTKTIVAISEEGKVRQATELKLKRLEELVYVLKKRITNYEENASLADVISNHGTLPDLLQNNAILEKENKLLRLREQRFAHAPLLRRRRLMECSPAYLRLLVVALQNELAVSRRLIDKYGFESNPSLKLLTIPPVQPPEDVDLVDIDRMYEQRTLSVFGEQFAPADDAALAQRGQEEEAGTQESEDEARQQHSLAQRLSVFEHANVTLQAQVERLNSQLKQQREVRTSREDILVELIGGKRGSEFSSKEKRIAELQLKNEEIVEHEADLLEVIAEKDKTISLQEEVASELTETKEELLDENLALSERVLSLKKANDQLIVNDADRGRKFHALYLLCQSLTQALVEQLKLPQRRTRATVQYMFADLLRVYSKLTWAAVRLQCAWRGFKARKALGDKVIRRPNNAAQLPSASADDADGLEDVTNAQLQRAKLMRTDIDRVLVTRGLPQANGQILYPDDEFEFYLVHGVNVPGAESDRVDAVSVPHKYNEDGEAVARDERQAIWMRDFVARTGDFVVSEHGAFFTERVATALELNKVAALARRAKSQLRLRSLKNPAGTGGDEGDAGEPAPAAIIDLGPDREEEEEEEERGESSDHDSSDAASPPPAYIAENVVALWTSLIDATESVRVRVANKQGEPQVLPAFRALAEMALAVPHETERVSQLPSMLRLAKRELTEVLRPEIERQLREAQQDMNHAIMSLQQQVNGLLLKPKIGRTTQTKVPLADSFTQMEEEEDPKAKTATKGKKK